VSRRNLCRVPEVYLYCVWFDSCTQPPRLRAFIIQEAEAYTLLTAYGYVAWRTLQGKETFTDSFPTEKNDLTSISLEQRAKLAMTPHLSPRHYRSLHAQRIVALVYRIWHTVGALLSA
jgi:hypothetical protein